MVNEKEILKNASVVTTNACKLCTPLGACVAMKGIENTMTLLHGSQGCATYIRRYLISHFREPIDIASSNFTENATIFGGGLNLSTGLKNVTTQYHPALIGVATTCLSETIGEDVKTMVRNYQKSEEVSASADQPLIIHMSTPSYKGTHMDGFHAVTRAAVAALAKDGAPKKQLNILPGFVSPADIRYLKEILADLQLEYVMLPDYSETLDGPTWDDYQKIPSGGTSVAAIETMGCSQATIEFGRTLDPNLTAGKILRERFKTLRFQLGMPIGVRETDLFFELLKTYTAAALPVKYELERGRLIDSYIDGHKYVFEKKAVVYGDEDLVVGLVSFLAEIGIIPVLCASGGVSGRLAKAIHDVAPELEDRITVRQGVDFMEIGTEAEKLGADLFIGNSKGYQNARKLKVPLVRVGFPIHDRIGSGRIVHLGYRGAQELFDRIVNTLLENRQDNSSVGYSYM
ncbi:MAG TPA: nitrogenase [Firmicutes bacterium]|jgi:nitrogenase molybdenum-iron protein NifN|nr:nitrogenase [Bacillota bacterium]